MPEKNKVPLGKPLELTDAELDAMTTADEIKKAQKEAEELWRKSVKPEIADLLDALDTPE
jgi:hypothetical protein